MFVYNSQNRYATHIPNANFWTAQYWTPVYTNPSDIVSQPVQDQILDQLQTQLLTITTANSFNTDIGEVNKGTRSPENIRKWPAINILVGPETYFNPTANEAGRLMKTMTVVLDVYMKGKKTRQEKLSDLIADIELCLYDDTVANERYNLSGKCLVMQPVQTLPFELESSDNMYGFEHEFMIKYRQKRSDPTTLYN